MHIKINRAQFDLFMDSAGKAERRSEPRTQSDGQKPKAQRHTPAPRPAGM